MNDDRDNNNKFPGNQEPDFYSSPEDRYEEAQQQAPAVSAPAAKNFIFVGVFALIVIGIGYAFLSGGDKKEEVRKETNRPAPARPAPPVIQPPAPIQAPPPPAVVPIDEPEDTKSSIFSSKDNAERVKRVQSDMLITKSILGGTNLGSGNTGNNASTLTEINDTDPATGFADSFYNQKDVPFAQARKLGDTSRLITQGKIIESILETPINTDVPGMIRAIVSRDIYAESGRTILIPKGSRLVGTYNNFVIRGNKRVNVIWSRVIRPDGIDVMIRSSGTDQLGRAGVEGVVDNKYAEIFASAFLVSAINIAVGIGVDAIEDDRMTQTINTDGSTTSSSTAKQDAAIRAIDLFGDAGENLVEGFLNLKPTITIDQGTRVNVFVNRDLVFPANVSGQVKFIQ